jgi:hypothetical protein
MDWEERTPRHPHTQACFEDGGSQRRIPVSHYSVFHPHANSLRGQEKCRSAGFLHTARNVRVTVSRFPYLQASPCIERI